MSVPGEPVQPRLAVSVLMLRRNGAQLEVFIQNRVETMDFAPGVVVFPGGRVDGSDHVAARIRPPSPAVSRRDVAAWRNTAIAATGERSLRELSGILLAAAIREVQEETGAVLTGEELLPWANWVTPAGYPKRFDTYFYLAFAAPSQEPRHQTTEAHSSHWASVRDVLQQAADGALKLMHPTYHLLTELTGLESTDLAPGADVSRVERWIVPGGGQR